MSTRTIGDLVTYHKGDMVAVLSTVTAVRDVPVEDTCDLAAVPPSPYGPWTDIPPGPGPNQYVYPAEPVPETIKIGTDLAFRLPGGPSAGKYRAAKVTRVLATGNLDLTIFTCAADGTAYYTKGVYGTANISHGTNYGQWLWVDELPAGAETGL